MSVPQELFWVCLFLMSCFGYVCSSSVPNFVRLSKVNGIQQNSTLLLAACNGNSGCEEGSDSWLPANFYPHQTLIYWWRNWPFQSILFLCEIKTKFLKELVVFLCFFALVFFQPGLENQSKLSLCFVLKTNVGKKTCGQFQLLSRVELRSHKQISCVWDTRWIRNVVIKKIQIAHIWTWELICYCVYTRLHILCSKVHDFWKVCLYKLFVPESRKLPIRRVVRRQ